MSATTKDTFRDEPEIITAYKTKGPPSRNKKNLQMMFKARLKKGAEPQFITYDLIKKQYPYLLIDFLEKRITINQANDLKKGKSPDVKVQKQYRENSRLKRDKTIQKDKSFEKQRYTEKQRFQKQSNNYRQIQRDYDRQEYEPLKKTPFRESFKEYYRSPLKQKQMTGDKSYAEKKDFYYSRQKKQEIEKNDYNLSDQQDDQSQESKQETKGKKILDYDYFIEENAYMNLVSPAVIPLVKLKGESQKFNYTLPVRINFKELQRQQYQSESFKESEYSEFVLDERGKEKRKRQKMLLKEQERMMMKKRKKFKRMKKKK